MVEKDAELEGTNDGNIKKECQEQTMIIMFFWKNRQTMVTLTSELALKCNKQWKMVIFQQLIMWCMMGLLLLVLLAENSFWLV